MQKFRSVISFSTFLFGLLFFSLAFLPNSTLADGKSETIRLQLKWKNAFQFAGYYAALEMGYYEEAGLDVSIIEQQGQKSPLQTLLDGEAEYAVTGADILLLRAKGDPVIALATIFQHSPYAFLVRADSGIKKVEDFAGLRVMLGLGAQDAALHATMRRAGIGLDDIIHQPTNFDAHSLIRDETDVFSAYITDQGFSLNAAGVEGRFLLPKQYGVDFYGDVLATTEKEANLHPKRTRAFRDASLRGWDYALNHPEKSITLILEKYNTQGLSREHLEYEMQVSRELIQPLLVQIGYMNPARWDHIKSIFVELGFITSSSSIDGLIYDEHKEVQSWAQWVFDHRVILIPSIMFFFIATLLLTLFQMRRLVRRRTAELAESEQHWRELVDAEPACVNTLNREGNVTSINSSGLIIMEADSFKQIQGKDIVEQLDREYQEPFRQMLKKVFEGESSSMVFKATGFKGGRKWIDSHAVPFRNSEGEITHLLGVSHDITERKNAETKQKRLQREFSQKHKMVALGQMSGGIAHDFNNILGIITGYTELAQDCNEELGSTRQEKYLKKIELAAHRARNLVDQLLAFSRGETMEEKPLQIKPLVEEDIKMSRSTMPSSIEIVTELDDGLPKVLVDPVQLNQIIMNLCINARDAMGSVGVLKIRLGMAENLSAECFACHQTINGDWVELAVSDTGTGIEPAILQLLFDPFFTTKEVGKGTGMGLAVIHGILGRLGGHIIVETELGKGSTFRLLLPPISGDTPSQEKTSATRQSFPKGAQKHVLVLDDEPELAAFVGDLLVLSGYRATVSTNSTEALELFKASPDEFSLLITDQTMPGLTGVELTGLCREIRPSFPVILCTGFSEVINKSVAENNRIGFIKKPIDTEQLMLLAGQLIQLNELKT